jgi:hypothetical protein
MGLLLLSAPAVAADFVGVPRISDGDTVEIAGTKIRLNGIDAPEAKHFCLNDKGKSWGCGQIFGDQASSRDPLTIEWKDERVGRESQPDDLSHVAVGTGRSVEERPPNLTRCVLIDCDHEDPARLP